MNSLGISQERIATRLGLDQKTIHYHLGKKAELPFSLNTDLSKGFTVSQVAEAGMGVGPQQHIEIYKTLKFCVK